MSLFPIVQTSEKGAYPELMCATYDGLNEKAYYDPTGSMNWVGAVDECEVESFVWDENIASKLWILSEEETSFKWNLN